jgi:hypothetical protein
VLNHVFIGHTANASKAGYGSVEGLGSEIAQGQHLIVRETSRTKLFIGAIEQILRQGMNSDPADVMKALKHAPMNCGCGFAVKLLVDDRLDQSFKGRL